MFHKFLPLIVILLCSGNVRPTPLRSDPNYPHTLPIDSDRRNWIEEALLKVNDAVTEKNPILFLGPLTESMEVEVEENDNVKAENSTTTTTTAAPTTTISTTTAHKSSTPRIVPLSEWHCGANDWDKWLAHSATEEDCPSAMVPANECCLAHDICYVEELSRELCDNAFCNCLQEVLKPANCSHLANSFCNAVELFGEAAHRNSKVAESTSTTTQSAVQTEEVPIQPIDVVATTKPSKTTNEHAITVPSQTQTLEFIAWMHTRLNLLCFENNLRNESACLSQLSSCEHGVAECATDFCACTAPNLIRTSDMMGMECENQFNIICQPYLHGNVHLQRPPMADFWSLRVHYFGFEVPFLHAFLISVILSGTLLTIIYTAFGSLRRRRRNQIRKAASRRLSASAVAAGGKIIKPDPNSSGSSTSSSSSSFYLTDTRPSSRLLLSN